MEPGDAFIVGVFNYCDRWCAHLVWLGEKVEEVFPKARAFVSPAFDEPEEVARLLASEARMR